MLISEGNITKKTFQNNFGFLLAHIYTNTGSSPGILTSNNVPVRASHPALQCATRTKVNMCFAHGKKDKEKKERKQEKNIHDTNDVSPVSYTHLTLPTIYSV